MNANKKLKFTTLTEQQQHGEEDILSKVPDELIHHILWFLDVQLAVQTSLLSKRWKLGWTTLPFLFFRVYYTTNFNFFTKLPESYLTCLPCLQTLLLDGFELPKSICLPTLTTLILYDVEFTDNVSEFFHALVNLRNLTLLFRRGVCANFFVNCPQLVNLEIENYTCPIDMISDSGKNHRVMVLAPNIRNFTSVNFGPITFGVTKLESVNLKFEEFDDDITQIETVAAHKEAKKYCRLITDMFWGFTGAKILTFDLKLIISS
ncbi:putative FBD-associated F-box protein At5g22720 [Apium graveolens]|uniref:putative FBD-associated F-box protein At5g22720 n=1 Tax=Apium graveolens TaxID=4045 RepID=UPI003D7B8139